MSILEFMNEKSCVCKGNFFFLILCIYFWLCWVFASARGLSPAAASGGHSSSRCAGLSPPRPLPLRSTGSRRTGSVGVAHGPSRSAARGIPPVQGPNPRPPHWQADSQPLRHRGSPVRVIFICRFLTSSHHCFIKSFMEIFNTQRFSSAISSNHIQYIKSYLGCLLHNYIHCFIW